MLSVDEEIGASAWRSRDRPGLLESIDEESVERRRVVDVGQRVPEDSKQRVADRPDVSLYPPVGDVEETFSTKI